MSSRYALTRPLPKETFRLYDIRGKSGTQLTPPFAFALGRAFADHIAAKSGCETRELTLCVGRDCRLSSPDLEEAIASGVVTAGAKVVRIGLAPTPALYFSVKHFQADGGVMVTGSHNPKDDNGFKCMDSQLALHGPAIIDLMRRMHDSDDSVAPVAPPSEFHDIHALYIDKIVSIALSQAAQKNMTFKAAWDPGNGAVAAVVKELTARLPGEHILINDVPDGNFPDHHPDPSDPKNLRRLQQLVQDERCDVGFAFDGDGDRLGVVTSEGAAASSDALGFVFARDCVERFPKGLCVFDVKTSGATFVAIEKAGGRTVMGKTGHSIMKEKMRLSGAVFGAEASGHLFFAEHHGFDDGPFAAMRFMDIMYRRGESSVTLANSLSRGYRTPEWRLDVGEEEKWMLLDGLRQALHADKIEFCNLDGIRIDDEDGWWVARVSNTQPAIVVMAESDSPEKLRERIAYLDALCAKAGFDLGLLARYEKTI